MTFHDCSEMQNVYLIHDYDSSTIEKPFIFRGDYPLNPFHKEMLFLQFINKSVFPLCPQII